MRSRHFIAILLFVSHGGCASVGARTGAYSDQAPIYPATAIDTGNITYVVCRPFLAADPMFRPDAQEGLMYVVAPAAIIDLPLAVTVDTLLLPYDVYSMLTKEPDQDSFRDWKDIVKDKSPNDPFLDGAE